MKIVRSKLLGIAFGCTALSGNAISAIVDFENLALSAPSPANPIDNNLGDSNSFNDLVFKTWQDDGAVRLPSQVGSASIVGFPPAPTNNLDPTSTRAISLVPIAGIYPGSLLYPYTEMTFRMPGQSLTGNFSFQYATGRGALVQFFSGTSLMLSQQLLDTPDNGTSWQVYEKDFNQTEVTSVRFLSQGNPNSPDLPKDSVFIDNMSINYAHSAMVPEPSTYAFMLMGLFGIGFVARRRMS